MEQFLYETESVTSTILEKARGSRNVETSSSDVNTASRMTAVDTAA